MTFRTLRSGIQHEILDELGLADVHPEIAMFARLNGYSIAEVERVVDDVIASSDGRRQHVTTEAIVDALRQIEAVKAYGEELKAERAASEAQNQLKSKAANRAKKWAYPKKLRKAIGV